MQFSSLQPCTELANKVGQAGRTATAHRGGVRVVRFAALPAERSLAQAKGRSVKGNDTRAFASRLFQRGHDALPSQNRALLGLLQAQGACAHAVFRALTARLHFI